MRDCVDTVGVSGISIGLAIGVGRIGADVQRDQPSGLTILGQTGVACDGEACTI